MLRADGTIIGQSRDQLWRLIFMEFSQACHVIDTSFANTASRIDSICALECDYSGMGRGPGDSGGLQPLSEAVQTLLQLLHAQGALARHDVGVPGVGSAG
jgi:hypothetical protein